MGFFSTIGRIGSKIAGTVGSVIKRVGSTGQEIARRAGQFAAPLGSALGGLIGDNPVGNFIKGAGQKIGDFANTTGKAIAKNVSDIGSSISGIGNALSRKNTNNGQKGD